MKILITEEQYKSLFESSNKSNVVSEGDFDYLMDKENDISHLIENFFNSYVFPDFVVYFDVYKEGLGYDVKFYVNPKGFGNSQYGELYDLFYSIKEDFFEMAPFNTIIRFKWAWDVNKG